MVGREGTRERVKERGKEGERWCARSREGRREVAEKEKEREG